MNPLIKEIPTIPRPELFFGLVAPIGVDLSSAKLSLKSKLEFYGYKVIEIKITSIFQTIKRALSLDLELINQPLARRYDTYINFGNHLRKKFDYNAILAASAMLQIAERRASGSSSTPSVDDYQRKAYIVDQFKREEEILLFRTVYGRLFFQISVYSRRSARVDYLSRRFAESELVASPLSHRGDAERLVQRDESEMHDPNGQQLSRIFHDGDVIINADVYDPPVQEQVGRFIDLLFGSNAISPTKLEYGMSIAKSAALRTVDLSRQVGAAIFSKEGEVLALGSNEVPKANGGTYWCDEPTDDRDFRRGYDSNDKRKREIFLELMGKISVSLDGDPDKDLPGFRKALQLLASPDLIKKQEVRDSQFMDALEYGRIVHAEMSAICDCARNGNRIRGAVLYCTTFPCHMCAKLVVASGISTVYFLEPYPKSLVYDLHNDSIAVEANERGAFSHFKSVEFMHFYGISPRRFRELFERKKRKDNEGHFVPFKRGSEGTPIFEIKLPFYTQLEEYVIQNLLPDSFIGSESLKEASAT